MTRVTDVFLECQRAIDGGVLITRPSDSDKEFHFQNWFEDRLKGIALHYEKGFAHETEPTYHSYAERTEFSCAQMFMSNAFRFALRLSEDYEELLVSSKA